MSADTHSPALLFATMSALTGGAAMFVRVRDTRGRLHAFDFLPMATTLADLARQFATRRAKDPAYAHGCAGFTLENEPQLPTTAAGAFWETLASGRVHLCALPASPPE
jgi:hypothetical protein